MSNGTAALQIAVAALKLEPGSEIIMPSWTIISCAIAILEAHDLNPVSVEGALIVIGAATLASAAALMRSLRGKETGFVLGVAKKSELQDVMSVVPTLMPGHAAEGGGAPQPVGGGGEFGGAGASGNF